MPDICVFPAGNAVVAATEVEEIVRAEWRDLGIQIKKHGAKHIKFIGLIAAPEGIKALHEAHPDVDIYLGAQDDHLNENGYIVPGLGDAGDRIYGTK